MKTASILIICLALMGCAHHISLVDTQNGVERSRVEGTLGVFSTKVATTGNDQIYPNCKAKIGSMPGEEEQPLCVEQTRGDVTRRARTLDWYASPYRYGYGYPPSAYASPVPPPSR